MNNPFHLIRKAAGRHDPASEQIVTLQSDDWAAKLLRLVLPSGGTRYITPLGIVATRESFDGKPLEVKIKESGEPITLYPKLQVTGLAHFKDRDVKTEEGMAESRELATLLSANLHQHYDEQFVHLRARIHAAFVEVLGITCAGEMVDGIIDHEGKHAGSIQNRIRKELGIEIEWLLEADPASQDWIRKLQSVLPEKYTESFNHESRDNQFNLTYTCKIRTALPSRHHVVVRRAQSKVPPAEEIDNIFKSVRIVLDPALGDFTGGVKVWLYPNFWKLLRLAFQERVCKRIAEDFGYDIRFEDFKRERTASESDLTKLVEDQKRRQQEFLDYDQRVQDIRKALMKEEKDTGYDLKSDAVVRLRDALKDAKKDAAEAQERLQALSQGGGRERGNPNDSQALLLLTHFHDTLDLDHRELLTLEANK